MVDAEVARRAAEIRARSLRIADQAETIARGQVEREIARERAFLADAARGGTMALLRKLEKQWTPPWELLFAAKRFAALFARQSKGGAVDGTRTNRKTTLRDGDLLEFPPGRWPLDVNWLERLKPFPKDLVVEGRGMDETLLVLSHELRIRGEVASLTFRDLTLHCNDHYLESMSPNPYTLRLQRCRVIGFDMGAGGSDMLSGSVGALYATDCRIEAGFGRIPGSGNLFDVRGAFLARLERCTIVGPFQSVFYGWSGAAQLFFACRFERMRPSIRGHLEHPPGMVRFQDCSFDYLPDTASAHPPRRSFTELNPAWGTR